MYVLQTLCTVLVLSLSTDSYAAIKDQELFLSAFDHYKASNYEKALLLLNTVEAKGFPVFFALGNCSYHLDRPVDALVFWTRAEQNASYQEYCSIQENKKHAYLLLGQSSPLIPQYQLLIEYVTRTLSPRTIQCLLVLLWFLLIVTLKLFRGIKKVLAATTITLILLLLGISFYSWHNNSGKKYGFIIANNTPIYAGPNSGYHTVGTCACATLCEIGDWCDEWCQIKSGSLIGWIYRDSIKNV